VTRGAPVRRTKFPTEPALRGPDRGRSQSASPGSARSVPARRPCSEGDKVPARTTSAAALLPTTITGRRMLIRSTTPRRDQVRFAASCGIFVVRGVIHEAEQDVGPGTARGSLTERTRGQRRLSRLLRQDRREDGPPPRRTQRAADLVACGRAADRHSGSAPPGLAAAVRGRIDTDRRAPAQRDSRLDELKTGDLASDASLQ